MKDESVKRDRPFSLTGIPQFNGKPYGQAQAFAQLDEVDELPLRNHLVRSNAAVLLDIVNHAERPDATS